MKKNLLMTFLLAFFTLTSLIAQERKITGKVTSAEDGSNLPGVSVSIKGTTKGTQTNAEGVYSISVPNSTTLVFSFVGLNSQSISVGNQSVINVQLSTDSRQLSEVVVTGYSSVQKRTFSGATATISSREVAKQTFGSFDQALQGAATGVSVMANGGQPGQQAVVRIRGNGSKYVGDFRDGWANGNGTYTILANDIGNLQSSFKVVLKYSDSTLKYFIVTFLSFPIFTH
jgi:hypothetical protein